MELSLTLEQYFGHRAFRVGQERVVRALLAGKSSLAIFPTGGGKSLCFQLPAILLEGVTLVISPLIALMKDQVESLKRKKIAAARLDSTLNSAEVGEVMAALLGGNLKLLYVAPERLVNEGFLKAMKRVKVSLLVIDEAHCISEWGHNFRPDYLRIATLAKKMKWKTVLALTATATPKVADDIAAAFKITKGNRVQNSFRRANLSLHITPCPAGDRLQVLIDKLTTSDRLPAIVYVTQQVTAEHVATHLARNNINVQAYHAGLPDEHRAEVQDAFMQGRTQVLVATIAFGMGIDKADIRAVYHYNLPKTLENYQQEIGRAGRDGNASHCEMLACQDDLTILRNFIYGDTPTRQALRQLLDHLLRQGREFEISPWELTRSTDIRPMVLETVLTYLEMDGILESVGSRYTQFQVAFNPDRERVLAGYPLKEQKFLRQLFSGGKQGWKWVTLQMDEAAEVTGQKPEKIVLTLREMEVSGDLTLKASRSRNRYRLCADATERDPEVVCAKIQELFAQRENLDTARLEQVMALATDHKCLTKHILNYFGETMREPCGNCTSCLEKKRKPRVIPVSPIPVLDTVALQTIRDVIAERHAALRAPRQLARFLCGISSPATQRDRLTKHDAFGLLSAIPFHDVLVQTESMVLL